MPKKPSSQWLADPFIQRGLARCRDWILTSSQGAAENDSRLPHQLYESLERVLTDVERSIAAGDLDPWIALTTDRYRVGRVVADPPTSARAGRVGVLPLTANPFHWGHLLLALSCVVALRLDTVVFLVQRRSNYKRVKKSHRASAEHRYQMARVGAELFHPLLRHTDVALRNNKVGEAAVHDLRKLNRSRRLELVCLWGGETVERTRRILQQVVDFSARESDLGNSSLHQLSVAFLGRQPSSNRLTPAILSQIKRETGMPFECSLIRTEYHWPGELSSTQYRNTLCPALVPEGVHDYVRTKGLYGVPPGAGVGGRREPD